MTPREMYIQFLQIMERLNELEKTVAELQNSVRSTEGNDYGSKRPYKRRDSSQDSAGRG